MSDALNPFLAAQTMAALATQNDQEASEEEKEERGEKLTRTPGWGLCTPTTLPCLAAWLQPPGCK